MFHSPTTDDFNRGTVKKNKSNASEQREKIQGLSKDARKREKRNGSPYENPEKSFAGNAGERQIWKPRIKKKSTEKDDAVPGGEAVIEESGPEQKETYI